MHCVLEEYANSKGERNSFSALLVWCELERLEPLDFTVIDNNKKRKKYDKW